MLPAEQIIDDIMRTIVARFRPQRIVLFGSHARGDATEDSDFDIFVEMESHKSPPDRGADVSLALTPRQYSLDVVVYTPAEVEQLRGRVGSLLSVVEEEGRVLYERQ